MATQSPITCTMQADGSAVMEIFSDIGAWGYQLKNFTAALSGIAANEITLRINSPGGEVVEALAIHDLIKASDKRFTCEVYGICASAATLLALACDSIRMTANATWMVHEPSFTIGGTLAECDNLRETMSALRDKVYAIYSAATGKDVATLEADHAVDKYYTATEALEYGWVSEIIDNAAPAEENPDLFADPVEAQDFSPEEGEPVAARSATALSKLRAALGLSSKTERLEASLADWKRRALAAEATARGAQSIAAVARAEAVAAVQNVEARIAAATARALADVAAPSNLPAPSENLPERPKKDLRAIASAGGVDAAIDAVTALL